MKPFYLSKTLIFNVLYLLVALAGIFGYGGFAPSVEDGEKIAAVVALVNIGLRIITSQKLTL